MQPGPVRHDEVGESREAIHAVTAPAVSRVIDGDTLDLSDGTHLRVYGIDTPERGKRCYSEASNRLRQLAGSTVRLEDGPRLQDDFARRLAYL